MSQSSQEIRADATGDFEESFEKELMALPTGVFLLRILHFADNHKLEEKGHSTIFIKHPRGTQLYFDTQLGLYDVSKPLKNRQRHIITSSILSAKTRFCVDFCTFHKLAKKS